MRQLGHTFQALVPVVLVHKYIVYPRRSVWIAQAQRTRTLTTLILSGRQGWWRKGEALHLCSLRQQRPSCSLAGHDETTKDELSKPGPFLKRDAARWVPDGSGVVSCSPG